MLWLQKLLGRSKPGTDVIVPRIKHLNFLSALRGMGLPPDQMAVTLPFQADLLIAFAFDLPDMFRMVSYADLARLRVKAEDLRDIAVSNLRRSGYAAEFQGGKDLLYLSSGGHLEACSLLLPEIWQQLSHEVGDGIVACVPTRDSVLLTRSGSEKGPAMLRALASQLYATETVHALSLAQFAWTGTRWEVFSPPPPEGV